MVYGKILMQWHHETGGIKMKIEVLEKLVSMATPAVILSINPAVNITIAVIVL